MNSGFNIVVTGHLGFVGGHLVKKLDSPNRVIGLDLKEGNDIRTCDLPDATRCYHLAAQTDAQCRDGVYDASVNLMGTIALADFYGDKLVFASSSMVNYPVTPYAISKRAAEDYVRLRGGAVVRCCNLYGPGGHSLIDRVRQAVECHTAPVIYGRGHQMRTYAHVDVAVDALIRAQPGMTTIVPGITATVNQIVALLAPDVKPDYTYPASPFDIEYAPQL